jgi:hypothetical protein
MRSVEQCYEELARFCFQKLANLESRFIILCHRAKALGIDCDDLSDVKVSEPEEPAKPLRVVN